RLLALGDAQPAKLGTVDLILQANRLFDRAGTPADNEFPLLVGQLVDGPRGHPVGVLRQAKMADSGRQVLGHFGGPPGFESVKGGGRFGCTSQPELQLLQRRCAARARARRPISRRPTTPLRAMWTMSSLRQATSLAPSLSGAGMYPSSTAERNA